VPLKSTVPPENSASLKPTSPPENVTSMETSSIVRVAVWTPRSYRDTRRR
jgi:hypothetical protein